MFKSEYSFTWKLENFAFCQQSNGECLRSGILNPKHFDNLIGYLTLYPRGENERFSGFVSCSLYVNAVNPIDFLSCEIKAIGACGKTLKVHNWNNFLNQTVRTVLKCFDFLAIEDVIQDAEMCKEDALTICCTLRGINPIQDVTHEEFKCTKIGVDRHIFKLQISRGETAKHVIAFGSSRKIEFSISEVLDDVKINISKLDSEGEKGWFADCTFTLDKKRQSKIHSERVKCFFPPACSSEWDFPSANLTHEWKSYLSCCELMHYYPSHIDIHCEFSTSNGTYFSFAALKNDSICVLDKTDELLISTAPNDANYPSVQEDLRALFNNKKLSDVKLRVNDETLEVHKIVLIARSPVFAAIFDQQDETDTRSEVIDIVNIDAHTLKLFLQYLYTDAVDEMSYENATSLLMAAEKYQVLSLREKCAVFLKKEMSVDNVCDILSLASVVNHDNLKSASVEFIIANSGMILSSPQWMVWMKNNMELATAIFTKLTLVVSLAKAEI